MSAILALGCLATAPFLRADVVLDWTALALDCIRADNSGPTLSTRNLAILHTAVYDSVNSLFRSHQPYRFQLQQPPEASTEAAAVGAALEVILTLYPSFSYWAEDLYDGWLSSAASGPALTNGLRLGQQIALLALAARSEDGSSTTVTYLPSDAPGEWQRTPPAFRPPLTPQWRYVDTFCLPEVEPFVPLPPPALDSPEYAAAWHEVVDLGSVNSTLRTAEQSQIAVFWSDFSYTAMPPGHWHAITSTIAQARGNTLAENARLFALLSLAQADAAIVCWEAKYRYNLWRPISAIRRADEDGNLATDPLPEWNHFLASPPFPSYTSGHSTFSKASAEVLTSFFGTDAISFTATSDALPGVQRTYHSLAACADEIGMSRIYGGIHFPFDNIAGKACGAKVARYILANYLLPNERLPLLRIESLNNGAAQLRVHGHFGATCVVQVSSDLRTWQALETVAAKSGGRLVRDTNPNLPHGARFYRVFEPMGPPNPRPSRQVSSAK